MLWGHLLRSLPARSSDRPARFLLVESKSKRRRTRSLPLRHKLKSSDGKESNMVRPSPKTVTLAVLTPLTALNAALYFLAAAFHLGLKVAVGSAALGFPEPIPPAAVAEA